MKINQVGLFGTRIFETVEQHRCATHVGEESIGPIRTAWPEQSQQPD